MKKRASTRRGNPRDETANRLPQDKVSRGLLSDRLLPAFFVILVLLTLGIIVFAAGILLGIIPYE